MSSKVFFYCLKVWLASVLLGPPLFWGCLRQLDKDASYTFGDLLNFWAYGILYGLGFSVISFLLFLGGMFYIYRRNWPILQRRTATALLGIVLTIIPFLIFFGTLNFFLPETRIAFCLSYLLPIVAGIFLYRFPTPKKRGIKIDRS
ncbi:MAG TPA: hypothetical protein VNW04_02165 [Puia sp.]|jgi:hypothetical protein|nr:hypothetical protein [Puia sp.]